MHKIVSSHLRRFAIEQSLDGLDESKQFERFSNFSIVFKFYPTRFDVSTITSEEDDCGIDGIAFVIDGELVITPDEARTIFKRPKKNIIVDIIFVQSKRSEKFERGEILKFGDGVSDFRLFVTLYAKLTDKMPRQHTSNPKIPKVSKAIGSPFY
jgi:hypothetical protein